MTVDDTDFRGALGDARLSLDEAIRLANGELSLAALGNDEATRVAGHPGAGRADVIELAPGLRIALRRRSETVDAILPTLVDAGDAIEGGGATIDGSAMEGRPQPGSIESPIVVDDRFATEAIAPLLVVAASDVVVRGLVVEAVPATAFVVLGGAGGAERVTIADNVVRGLGRNSASGGVFVMAGFNTGNQSLFDVSITGNQIADVTSGIVMVAGVGSGDGALAHDNRLERVRVAGNRVERPISGLIFYAGQALLAGRAEDNLLQDVDVRDNEVVDNVDVALLASATQPLLSGPTARNTVRGLRFVHNRVTSPTVRGRQNSGMYLSGGQVFANGTSSTDSVAELDVEGNVVDGLGTGLLVFGGVAERCGEGCGTSASSLSGLRLRDNVWRTNDVGAILAGGAGFEIAGSVHDNLLGDVLLERETIESGQVGLLVTGSTANGLPLGGNFFAGGIEFPGYRRPGEQRNNRVRGLVVRDSLVRAENPIQLSGGLMTRTEDTMRSSVLEDVAIENTTTIGGAVTIFGGIVVGAGTVRDCTVRDVHLRGLTDGSGRALTPVVLDQVAVDGASGGSVADNGVTDVVVE